MDIFLWGIHSHHQKCDWVQKVRTHSSLLGTCVHFHAYLHFFPQIDGDGCHFWIIFYGEFIPIIKNVMSVKSARPHALLGTCAHFLAYLHFFPKMADDGCILGFFLIN